MLELALAIIGVLALALATSGRYLDRWAVSAPLIALVVGVVVGPEVLDLLHVPRPEREPLLHDAARLTLAVSLMGVALRFPVEALRQRRRQLAFLLLLVMPAMALATAGIAAATLGLGVGVALVLGTTLAPTDPVLASSIVSGAPAEEHVPDGLRVDLSIESGANDGLALPMVLLATVLLTATSASTALLDSLWKVGGAVLLGVLLGQGAGVLLRAAERHGAVEEGHAATYSLVLAFAALGLGGVARTDDLLVVFVAGLAFNARISSEERNTDELIDDAVHRLLVLPLFVLLGTALPWDSWRLLDGRAVAFVVGVLLLRRLPFVLLLRRPLRYRWPEAVWLGWFGPIGVAAVYYLTHLPSRGVHDPILWSVGSLVVVTSVAVHGITSSPGVRALGHALTARRSTPQPVGR